MPSPDFGPDFGPDQQEGGGTGGGGGGGTTPAVITPAVVSRAQGRYAVLTSDQAVTWSLVETGSAGLIPVVVTNATDGSCALLIPDTVPIGTYHVVATLTADGSTTTTVPVSVTAGDQLLRDIWSATVGNVITAPSGATVVYTCDDDAGAPRIQLSIDGSKNRSMERL